nr:uncharacterized protein LOC120363913 [Saimiri boliviensis boliviensis]
MRRQVRAKRAGWASAAQGRGACLPAAAAPETARALTRGRRRRLSNMAAPADVTGGCGRVGAAAGWAGGAGSGGRGPGRRRSAAAAAAAYTLAGPRCLSFPRCSCAP